MSGNNPTINLLLGDNIILKNTTGGHELEIKDLSTLEVISNENISNKTIRFEAIKKGKFEYYCVSHPAMKGIINVRSLDRHNFIGGYNNSSTNVYTDLISNEHNITTDTLSNRIYYDNFTNTNILFKGDIIKLTHEIDTYYKRVYDTYIDENNLHYFTIYDSSDDLNIQDPITLDNTIIEVTNNTYNYTKYIKVNYKLLFNNLSVYDQSSFNVTHVQENNINYTKVTIPENDIYTFNINVNFDLTYGTSYSVLYVNLKREGINSYVRTFYSPSISPAYHNFSSSINASFKIKLKENDEITFESNYKLQEGFIDIDL